MRKQFIFGMLTAPALLLLYMGAKSLFAPSVVLTEDELSQFKLEVSYSTQFENKPISETLITVKKGFKFQEVKAGDLTKGKPTIIHIWATWCGACNHEMPSFTKFANKHKGKYNILAISVDTAETAEEASKIVEKYNKEKGYKGVNIAYDHTALFTHSVKPDGVPTTLFLNAEGIEIGRVNGALSWNDKTTEHLLKSVFAKE